MKNRLLALAFAAAIATHAAATITIVNGDPDGMGFNDPTPVDPVGGNTGTTLGQQRQFAFQAAADKWGATLNSIVPIRVLASWEALSCTDSSAVLGSAGAVAVFRNFVNVPRMATWYSKAQANALAGVDLSPSLPDIKARFNVNLGSPGCLTGSFFYLGFDGNHGNNADLVTILIHEFAHGLGFQSYTSGLTGAQQAGTPSAWDYFLLDTTTGKTWDQMTDGERASSALKVGKLVWTGSQVNTAAAASVLALGTPSLRITQPLSVAGSYLIGPASFGPALGDPALNGEVATFADTAGQALACGGLSPDNAAAVAGKIALIDRGTCTFVIKAANLQAAGAIGMIVADNVAGAPPPALGGSDPSIMIPAVRISQADGVSLKAALAAGTSSALLGLNTAQLKGADTNGNMLMYLVDPYQSGSSVAHFDTSAFPNQLMEPFVNDDLTHELTPPFDLTLMLLRDIGWP